MNFDLLDKTHFLTVAGSWMYGTATETSDVDIRGWCIPPREYRDGFLHNFEQADSPQAMEPFRALATSHFQGARPAPEEKIDGAVYDVRKFVRLAVDCNPNILDVLFAPRDMVLIESHLGTTLRNARKAFLSRKVVHTFRGYAVAQIKKIERHRKWLLAPPSARPERADFGLTARAIPADQLGAVLAEVRARIDSWEVDFGDTPSATKIHVQEQLERTLSDWRLTDLFVPTGRLLGYDTNFLAEIDKERRYKKALEDWNHYQEWKVSRNAARASLEAIHGYDTKHGMQLVRLLQACREILVTGDYNPRRPNRDELLGIRSGAWSYDRLLGWSKDQDEELLALAASSPLPRAPDRNWIDGLLVDLVGRT